jgi:hypothetical protein
MSTLGILTTVFDILLFGYVAFKLYIIFNSKEEGQDYEQVD